MNFEAENSLFFHLTLIALGESIKTLRRQGFRHYGGSMDRVRIKELLEEVSVGGDILQGTSMLYRKMESADVKELFILIEVVESHLREAINRVYGEVLKESNNVD